MMLGPVLWTPVKHQHSEGQPVGWLLRAPAYYGI
jgi:hypothetical protein